jgi:hypothetical protein
MSIVKRRLKKIRSQEGDFACTVQYGNSCPDMSFLLSLSVITFCTSDKELGEHCFQDEEVWR